VITIISSTNRLGANTRVLCLGHASQILDLRDLPEDFIFSATFDKAGTHPAFNAIQQMIHDCEKFVFIVPEYNASFPGILKAFIDSLSFPSSFSGKAAAIVGISSGSMGGALAISHLTDILNYLGMFVLPIKPRLAGVNKMIHEGKLANDLYMSLLQMQAKQLVDFHCLTGKKQ
jgi:chromate reductase, NAD(P)H dehydrogenase (quinone)